MRQSVFDHIAQQLSRRAGPVAAVYVFGSTARGAAGRESDVDLAIVRPRRSEELLEPVLRSLSDDVRERFGAELNVIVDRGDSKKRAPIWRTIEREGIRILPRRGASG